MKVKKYFLCTGAIVPYEELYKHQGAHIVGHLQHLTDEGHEVTAFARWTVSIPTNEVPPILPEIDVYLIGDARRIKCRYTDCQRVQRWEIGKAAFEQLMSRYRRESHEPAA